MKLRQHRLGAGTRILQRIGLLLLLATAVLVGNPVMAQQQAPTPESDEITGAAKSIAATMNPNSWALMMTMSMDPRIWANPISMCAACHDNEDVGRYQQVFGPFVSAMMNPVLMGNPEVYNNMMASALDPKAAEHWQRAVEKKYGLQPGDSVPTMHNWWPWGMMPYTPMPQSAQ